MILIPWLLSGGVVALSVIVWGQGLGWQLSRVGAYQLFPLFGLLAFTLMWAHYAVDFLQRFFKFETDRWYLPVTRYIVLFALFMHPGLLTWQQWRDGIPMNHSLWIIVGFVAWLSFIFFELHRWFRGKPWWRWVVAANAGAMIAIIFHALNLGSNLQGGWFVYVWYFFGISLAVFLIKELYDYCKIRFAA